MRYIKVLLLVLLFFFVMLFFVQNQAAFSQVTPLKLDLMFIPAMQSAPLPLYSLMLFCFVFGALCTMAMLVWDRLTIGTKLTFANMRVRSLEKDVARAQKASTAAEEKTATIQTRLTEAQEQVKQAGQQLKEAETRVKEAEARANQAEQAA